MDRCGYGSVSNASASSSGGGGGGSSAGSSSGGRLRRSDVRRGECFSGNNSFLFLFRVSRSRDDGDEEEKTQNKKKRFPPFLLSIQLQNRPPPRGPPRPRRGGRRQPCHGLLQLRALLRHLLQVLGEEEEIFLSLCLFKLFFPFLFLL